MAHKMECTKWVPSQDGFIYDDAIEIGISGLTGEAMYVGRVFDTSTGEPVPGKVVPSHEALYFGSHGEEQRATHYEVLVASHRCQLHWVPATRGAIPAGAIEAGFCTKSAEPVFIARASLVEKDGTRGVHGGRVAPSEGCAFIPYNGHEVAVPNYEVLCAKFLYNNYGC